ncbi:MAG: response regulator [Steroidobacteraceae bacterium]|nr:response regulator [Steroidobacteraceae bacterium]
MARILIADDRSEDRRLLRLVLERMGHEVIEAVNGQRALDLARTSTPDLVVSDILMPVMDGFTLCRKLQEDATLRRVPFLFVTATYGEQRYQEFASDLGAARVLLKPFEVQDLREIVAEVLEQGPPHDATQRLELLNETDFHERHAMTVNWKLEEKVNELESANAKLRASDAHTRSLLTAMVETISKMVECRDPYTTGHERRVGELAAAIGLSLGYDESGVEGLRMGGYLHDVGKIAVPSEILTKPGRLTEIEFNMIKAHAQIGFDILSGIDFPWQVAEMARQHHERLDGSGYPRGLVGDAILPEARVLAVADVVEAMVSHRPYRPAVGLAKALAELERGRGSIYDPAAADACLHLLQTGSFQFD